ncbi:MAG TPA: YihY/virulence factor BrkB family protein [Terracidiphilus sp.]|nr:YihY/virulence factor BrkB family protein [Terracidiphilus sp.]
MPTPTPIVDRRLNQHDRRIWELVARSPLQSLWTRDGLTFGKIAKCIWQSIMEDRIFGHSAELGFYFLFSLFPTLLCASAILGLVARSAATIYDRLLSYLAFVVPTSAFHAVLSTFNQTAASASSGKITFGLIAAVWSASVGVSAVQETLDVVYKINDRRSYIKARIQAIGLTIILIGTISLCLSSLFLGDFAARWAHQDLRGPFLAETVAIASRICGWILATAFLALTFSLTYYWAPDLRARRWRWLTPGAAIGMAAWLIASLGLRIYLHFFNTYTVTYGSLGAVIILLMWFYITGLMLLVGAEINSEIEASAVEARITPLLPSRDTVAPAA